MYPNVTHKHTSVDRAHTACVCGCDLTELRDLLSLKNDGRRDNDEVCSIVVNTILHYQAISFVMYYVMVKMAMSSKVFELDSLSLFYHLLF